MIVSLSRVEPSMGDGDFGGAFFSRLFYGLVFGGLATGVAAAAWASSRPKGKRLVPMSIATVGFGVCAATTLYGARQWARQKAATALALKLSGKTTPAPAPATSWTAVE